MEGDIWAGDHLNRQEDAAYLYAYLLQRNRQAVERGEKGTSINLNAPWGAGKTFFISRFAQQLRLEGKRVAEVNAWRDDHADDPIFAVMSAILKALGKSGKKATLREALKNNAGKIAVRSGQGLLKRAAAFIVGQEAVEGIGDDLAKSLVEAGEATLNEYTEDALERFEEGQKAIDDFRRELTEEVQGKDPIFVLVDELDRCRPTYAVSVLERVKHLFDVPNIIFVFATNADQLRHTIKQVYGAGFDAERYLHRFFDRTYQFDPPSMRQFIDMKWDSLEFDKARFLTFRGLDQIDAIAIISAAKGLQLRDIDQCLDTLWSVAEFADARVSIPLLYLFPLIAAYHLRQLEAFVVAAGETKWDGRRDGPFGGFFDQTVLFQHVRYDRSGERSVTTDTTLYDVMAQFRQLAERGLSVPLQSDGRAAEYAEHFRMLELNARYRGQSTHPYTPSVVAAYGSMIRRAGRVTPIPGA